MKDKKINKFERVCLLMREVDPVVLGGVNFYYTDLGADVRNFKPELQYLQVFGDPNQKHNIQFPTDEDLQKFPLDKEIKLKEICWKNHYVLRGMQFKFLNAVETPLFQQEQTAKESESYKELCLKSQYIDQSRTIRKVSVMYDQYQKFLLEMKFIDEQDQAIHHYIWDGGQNHKWATVEIPQGYEIIGLQTCFDSGHLRAIEDLDQLFGDRTNLLWCDALSHPYCFSNNSKTVNHKFKVKIYENI